MLNIRKALSFWGGIIAEDMVYGFQKACSLISGVPLGGANLLPELTTVGIPR